jgi:hypothetical protein
MARHLTDADVVKITAILDGWKGSLTWERLCDECVPRIGFRPVRQTLYRAATIQSAFEATKKRLSKRDADLSMPSSLRAAAERIARLEAENARLKQDNSHLLNQFVVWQYNAHMMGLTKDQLNRDLPKVDLGTTSDVQ